VFVLFTSLQNILILPIIVKVHADVKSANVVRPHKWDIRLCIFAIIWKTSFVDKVLLCCKPSIY